MEVSVGVIENDQIIVTAGPLKGMEGCIRRNDRHKRAARLEVQVGLEVVAKQ